MSMYYAEPGLNHVDSYLGSAVPYVSSSIAVPGSASNPVKIDFPYITKFIVVTNTLAGSAANVPLRFGFSANGVKGVENNNYLILNNGESFEAEYRVSSVFLLSDTTAACSASIAAGVTGIKVTNLVQNWSGSLGVG